MYPLNFQWTRPSLTSGNVQAAESGSTGQALQASYTQLCSHLIGAHAERRTSALKHAEELLEHSRYLKQSAEYYSSIGEEEKAAETLAMARDLFEFSLDLFASAL